MPVHRTVALLIVILGLPLWAVIALAIKLGSRGPVFYADRRVGLNEREFHMLKFRTMIEGALSVVAVLLVTLWLSSAVERQVLTRMSPSIHGARWARHRPQSVFT